MAKARRAQSYPRIDDEKNKYHGYFDDTSVVDHQLKLSPEDMKSIVEDGITYAQKKSSREIMDIDPSLTGDDLLKAYQEVGKDLFTYFVRYCGDPASTAFDCHKKHYEDIARENFRNRTIQKERMNAGWRYQHIAKDAARKTGRFETVSDINSIEADFNATVNYKSQPGKLNVYISMKNRSNTMGGQDWPKAIGALEDAANADKNRDGHYLCVFGIAMERGLRNIKYSKATKTPYSMNTEVWFSDFFWPFVANEEYEGVAKFVLDVLVSSGSKSSLDIPIPQEVLDAFGERCNELDLLDAEGNFNDPYKLVDLFCGKLKK